MKQKAMPAAVPPVPQNDDAAREAIREIGDLKRAVLRHQADLNDQVQALQERYGHEVAPLNERVTALTEGLRMFAEVHRDRLTRGGKVKFAEFSTGKLSWRNRPPKVSLKKVDEVILRIKEAGLTAFLRVKEEVDKDAMLADPATATAIKGVTIGSEGEDFIVEPAETELAGGAS